jgi:hypothetical protein
MSAVIYFVVGLVFVVFLALSLMGLQTIDR